MAYTNTWSVAAPTDPSPANAIASYDRQTRLNVQERLNSIIGVAIGTALADPIIPVTQSMLIYRTELDLLNPLLPLNAILNQEFYIHGSAGQFYPVTYVKPANAETGLIIAQASHGSPNKVIFSLSAIPIGATLIDATIYWTAPATTSMRLIAYRQAFSALTALADTGGLLIGNGALITTVLAYPALTVVLTANAYYLDVATTQGAGDTITIWGVKVRYSTPTANVRR